MKRRRIFLPIALLFCLAIFLPLEASGTDSSRYVPLVARFEKVAGRVGIEVVSLASGQTLFEHCSHDLFVPASLAKVFTSYAALKLLGASHHFDTAVLAGDEPRDGVVSGPVWVRSEGDIMLTAERLWGLASRLKARGVRSIRGGVVVDNGYFKPQAERVCLDEKCEENYNPMVSATSLEFNSVSLDVRAGGKAGGPAQVSVFPPGDYVSLSNVASTGSKSPKMHLKVKSLGMDAGREKFQVSGKLPVGREKDYEYRFSVDDPAAFFARSFKGILQQAGIEVSGSGGQGEAPAGAKVLASCESPALGDLLYGLNRFSNNFMAEMLLRDLGALAVDPPGTAQKGVLAIRKALQPIGIADEEVSLDSGSGLSRGCRVTPHALSRVMASAFQDGSIGPEFLASLAVNAQEGTLKRRLSKPGILVRGKTGTLRDVVGFSGFVSGGGKGPFVVTVILNDVKELGEARETVDSFIEQVPAL